MKTLASWLVICLLIGCQGENRNLGYPRRHKDEVVCVHTASTTAVISSTAKAKVKPPLTDEYF